MKLLWIFIIALLCFAWVASKDTKPSEVAATTVPTQPTQLTFTCEAGQPASGQVVYVEGKDHPLYSAPSENSARLINKKASSILKRKEYHVLDNSTQVQIQCISGDWARVQIVEPDWLNFVVGWTKQNILAKPEDAGLHKFTEKDFSWNKDTLPLKYKDVVVKAVNKIHQENSVCRQHIDIAFTFLSLEKSKKGKPTFFVSCGKFPHAINVYFTSDDLVSNKVFVVPPHFSDPEGEGVRLCQQYARAHLNYPATVDFDWGVQKDEKGDGTTWIAQKLTAKNAFGVPQRFKIQCWFNASGMTEGELHEIVE